MPKSENLDNYYRITIDDRNLNYGNYISSGEVLIIKLRNIIHTIHHD